LPKVVAQQRRGRASKFEPATLRSQVRRPTTKPPRHPDKLYNLVLASRQYVVQLGRKAYRLHGVALVMHNHTSYRLIAILNSRTDSRPNTTLHRIIIYDTVTLLAYTSFCESHAVGAVIFMATVLLQEVENMSSAFCVVIVAHSWLKTAVRNIASSSVSWKTASHSRLNLNIGSRMSNPI